MWKPLLPPFRKYKKDMHEDPVVTGQFIFQIGESEDLRKPSPIVPLDKLNTKEYQAKIAYLKHCMLEYRRLTKKGRAIAGVQVGIPEQMVVVYLPERKDKTWVLLNPHITDRSKELYEYPEMCMSCNSMIAPVVRPAWIECTYYDEKGRQHVWDTKDTTEKGRIDNRVLQHEIDHLHGIINIDRVESRKLIFLSDPTFYAKATFKKIKNSKTA